MSRLSFAAPFLLLAAPAAAQGIDWSTAPHVDVTLSDYRIAPDRLRLAAGKPIVLRFHNRNADSHNFTARKFFAAAQVRAEDRRAVAGGALDFAGGEIREIGIVPARGSYPASCTQKYHATLGERGEIEVQ
jgi:hypothetical protein